MNKKCIVTAFKHSLPVLFGYIALGIAYGIVVVEKEYPWWLAPLSGIILFTGTGQFAAIGLFAAGAKLPAILITELLVGIRHIVYGLSLISKFSDVKGWKPYLIFSLSDETYSILTTVDIPEGVKKGPFYFCIGAFDQAYWIIGSTIGALLGSFIPFDFAGVDFALTALFAVLTVEQIKKTKDFIPLLCGGLTTLAAVLLWKFGLISSSSNILLIGMAAGLAVLTLSKSKSYRNSNQEGQTPSTTQEAE